MAPRSVFANRWAGTLWGLAICLVAGLAAGLAGCAQQPGYIKIKGSETVLPIALKLAEKYTADPGLPDISVTAGGSGVGIAALLEANTDIAMSSRAIKFEERVSFAERGVPFEELVVGLDALALVVHKENPLDSLSLEQVKAIYQGRITNWKELGGQDAPIVAFNRESSSGTYEFFKKVVLEKEDFGALQTVGANGELIEKVAENVLTIGYVGIAYLNPNVKAIRLYQPALGRSVSPTVAHSLDKTYPLVRPLYFYYLRQDEARLRPVLAFLKTQAGQELVLSVGYPPNPRYYTAP
ncbi:MAG: PstS family phosphate ABC transporter substrate-binding protein [Sphingobacteriia bacterium]